MSINTTEGIVFLRTSVNADCGPQFICIKMIVKIQVISIYHFHGGL